MADELSVALLEMLRKSQEMEGQSAGEEPLDFLREAVRKVAQAVIEAELEATIGAKRYERTEGRLNQRNGTTARSWDTKVGTVDLAIPKLRRGSFFPSLLEPRRRVDKALANVVVEAYVDGVTTRKIEDLVRRMGVAKMDQSMVSRLAKALDDDVEAFRTQRLDKPCRYVWLDATFPKVREGGRVITMALMIAIGVTEDGGRRILGLALGSGENGADWEDFLRSLVDRGLSGVQLVTSDDHQGLKAAVRKVFVGSAWQRCTVHFTRNCVAKVPKTAQSAVSALVRQIFAQPDLANARAALRRTSDSLETRFPAVAEMLTQAEDDLLTHMSFPQPTGARFALPTASSASTGNSLGASTSSASSPTAPPSSASEEPSSPNRTTSGRSAGATSVRSPSAPSLAPSLQTQARIQWPFQPSHHNKETWDSLFHLLTRHDPPPDPWLESVGLRWGVGQFLSGDVGQFTGSTALEMKVGEIRRRTLPHERDI